MGRLMGLMEVGSSSSPWKEKDMHTLVLSILYILVVLIDLVEL